MEQGTGLSGLKVLVVEDEPLIAMALADMLTEFGCTVAGPAASLKRGMRLMEEEAIDGAVLDINLGGEMVFPLADALAYSMLPLRSVITMETGLCSTARESWLAFCRVARLSSANETLLDISRSSATSSPRKQYTSSL